MKNNNRDYVIEDFNLSSLTQPFFLAQGIQLQLDGTSGFPKIIPRSLRLNEGVFTANVSSDSFPLVQVQQNGQRLQLHCPCDAPAAKLCEHQAQVLYAIRNRKEFRLFFDEELRHEAIRKIALAYGLEEEQALDEFFELHYQPDRSVDIRPRLKGLVPVQQFGAAFVEEQLLDKKPLLPESPTTQSTSRLIVVLAQHRFYHHLYIELFEATTSREGKIKNPLKTVAPAELIWKTDESEELKFLTAISKFQTNYQTEISTSAMEGLKALVRNPLSLPFFRHDAVASPNITASSIKPIQLKHLQPDLRLSVDRKGAFYEISGQMVIDERFYALEKLRIRYQYFIQTGQIFYLVEEPALLRVIEFFKQYDPGLLVHASKFEAFRENVLAKLEHKVRIHYSYVRPASKKQRVEQGFDQAAERLIYLSDSEDFVLITPVMRYGQVEIPVLSQKQLYATDSKGKPFTLERDEAAELGFIAQLLPQHPYFEEQLHLDYFYLHKERFLQNDWFLHAFEQWREMDIQILGFSELKTPQRLNPHKAKVNVIVSSGVDWFDTHIEAAFGKQKVSLKHLHKSLKNKSRYVQLDDGSLGILPQEWIEKFTKFFRSSEVAEDRLRMPKVAFSSLSELYEAEMLSPEVKEELALYREKIEAFEHIREVAVPEGLHGTLRPYQQKGLQWLSFLDEFNFGGCLADDMGLGKTIQILAFILTQREKPYHNTNLVVVPTTLLFNWQAEVKKFAPSIKVLLLHGPNRPKSSKSFEGHEIVLTTYGTLLSDIRLLKKFAFNYIFLDESQAIKNPESQRYKATRLLHSRNKIVLTGTPMENNTFDLYGQLSFACPGLLGSKRYFKGQYSDPIDKFKDSKRARELQKKISPFILRRTKEQVAQELPEKTEMTIYCEMGPEQRKLYNAYAKEYRDYLLDKDGGDIARHSLHILQGMTKLRQICNAPALLNDQQFYSSASAKIETLVEQIENKSERHKILVFSQFVGMLELIRKELNSREIPYEYLTGQTRNRKEKVERFQGEAGIRVFLISLKAGGTGLNLTEADYVYLVDPWWNPAVENQAIDRVHRIGQHKNVVAVRLICPDTIEEKIMQLQDTKRELAGELVKTDAGMLKSLSKEELLKLFS